MTYCKYCGADLPAGNKIKNMTWDKLKEYLIKTYLEYRNNFVNLSNKIYGTNTKGSLIFWFKPNNSCDWFAFDYYYNGGVNLYYKDTFICKFAGIENVKDFIKSIIGR